MPVDRRGCPEAGAEVHHADVVRPVGSPRPGVLELEDPHPGDPTHQPDTGLVELLDAFDGVDAEALVAPERLDDAIARTLVGAATGRRAFLVLHGDETVGVVLLHDDGAGTAHVILDFVTRRYRDFSPGEFVWRRSTVLREAGFRPDIVLMNSRAEDGDQPTAKTLRAARDVVVRVDRGADRATTEQLERLGVRPLRLETAATCEDAALILADASDASVIVGVGMHATLDEFLDRQRSGLASTYLTRLKVGEKLVDAKAVATLYRSRVSGGAIALLVLAMLVAVIAALWVSRADAAVFDWIVDYWNRFSLWVQGWVT